jgi:signal transduction histidine kinase
MRPRTLTARVGIASAAVALSVGILVTAALAAIIALRHAESRVSRTKDVTAAALRVRATTADEESALRGYALSASPRFLTLFRQAHAREPRDVATLRALVSEPAQRARVARLDAQLTAYYRDYARNVIVITQIAPSAVRGAAANTEDKRRTAAVRTTLAEILAAEDASAARASADARRVADGALAVGIGAGALSAALVLIFGLWVRRAVARPLRRVASAAADVAAGDFSVRLDERGAGEAGALVSAFNSMTRALDVSHRELVDRNAQLVESERHKRDLISMVSHELRTPLAAVVGFTALLLEREFPPDEQRRYLEIVDAQARRLAALAGDFLDVQLLSAGAMSIVHGSFDLVELVREQVHLFFLEPADHALDLELPQSPVVVDADRDRLAQVVGNLLSNALKYSPPATTVHVVLETNGSTAALAVTDEGVGIAASDQERIFDKFFRTADAAATVGGTGLGLAVAREIVAAHGGRIAVASAPGEGATFRIELPVAAHAPAPADA